MAVAQLFRLANKSAQGGTMLPAIKLIKKKELGRILRFGMVGFAATATHATMALFLVEGKGLDPLWANFFSFLLAAVVSFLGHYHWTFAALNPYATAFPRFFTIALLGLGLNQAIMFCTVSVLTLNYRLGLALVVVLVPGLTFLANRFWTFQLAHF
jgi:putative flippase GtrA